MEIENCPTSSPRQTLSYLRELFQTRGIRPKNKLGQSFLIDLNVLDLLVRTAQLTHGDLAVEVGSGTGSLTSRLAEDAGGVLSIEIDPSLFALTNETIGGRSNVHLLHADVLKNKNELNPKVLTAVEELRRHSGCRQLKLVANLPYSVATPVIANLLLSDLSFERMVVTVQWETAERLTARPGSKAYGALTVLVQSLAEVKLVRRLAPSVFWPRPQVASAIVLIRPSAVKRAHVGEAVRFRYFLRDLYAHRRKNLRAALSAWPTGPRDKHEVDAKLAQLGLDGTTRAEELDVEEHLRLFAAFGLMIKPAGMEATSKRSSSRSEYREEPRSRDRT
jgi:16S rRNA (adenine1518-N6/adenine1519-N6)-dimethyltransferase